MMMIEEGSRLAWEDPKRGTKTGTVHKVEHNVYVVWDVWGTKIRLPKDTPGIRVLPFRTSNSTIQQEFAFKNGRERAEAAIRERFKNKSPHEMGVSAEEQGRGEMSNPFQKGTKEEKEWTKGWWASRDVRNKRFSKSSGFDYSGRNR